MYWAPGRSTAGGLSVSTVWCAVSVRRVSGWPEPAPVTPQRAVGLVEAPITREQRPRQWGRQILRHWILPEYLSGPVVSVGAVISTPAVDDKKWEFQIFS